MRRRARGHALLKTYHLYEHDDMTPSERETLVAQPSAETATAAATIVADFERHLAQLEDRYRALLEAAPDAIVVVNHVGEIVLLNGQVEKQFGYRRDEVIGQNVKNLIPEGFSERLIAHGALTTADALKEHTGIAIELAGRRKNGSEFPIEITFSPLESADGVLITAAIRDISLRKQADAALRSSEERLRLAIWGRGFGIFSETRSAGRKSFVQCLG
jgi:PAS domain S-box-containing protein